MIHFDEAMIEIWAQRCRERHPGIRLENWRIYVRTVIAAINGEDAHSSPLSAAFDGNSPETKIVQPALRSLGSPEAER